MTNSPANIRPMLRDDLRKAVRLSQTAGWNQQPGDWQRLLDYQPEGCFVAEQNNQIVGTVTTTSYASSGLSGTVGWIGMMLVDVRLRRQGIASRLMKSAQDYLTQTGIEHILLDATPAGLPLYTRLGFQPQFEFYRWARNTDAPLLSVAPAPQTLVWNQLDCRAFAADRQTWLQAVAQGSRVEGHSEGFGMLRSGHLANYLGPVTAAAPTAAATVIDRLLSDQQGPVFWDIPSLNPAAESMAEARGFQRVRQLTRMWIGTGPPRSDYHLQFALCDPGTG